MDMAMDTVAYAHSYWSVVESTLMNLYGFEPDAAHAEVLRVCGPLTPAAIRQDVTYHSDPLRVASDLAGVSIISEKLSDAFDRLTETLPAYAALSDPGEAPMRKKSSRSQSAKLEAVAI